MINEMCPCWVRNCTCARGAHILVQEVLTYLCKRCSHTCARGAHILVQAVLTYLCKRCSHGEYPDSGVCDIGEGEVQVEETGATSGYVLHHCVLEWTCELWDVQFMQIMKTLCACMGVNTCTTQI